MIEVEKVYSDNPFVDEAIYYSKLMALNCVIKDEEEALSKETTESLKAGDAYIACIEGRANYEMFFTFPQEILEKYIESKSNLDLMVDNPSQLSVYLDSFDVYDRKALLDKLSKIASSTYVDHYNIMNDYIIDLGDRWFDNNKELYDTCCDDTATYKTLFDNIPKYTRRRIFDKYIINYDNTNLDSINESLEVFQRYVESRTDTMVGELDSINAAMRSVFKSHYEMMIERDYILDNSQDYIDFTSYEDVYRACIDGTATYETLYDHIPSTMKRETLLKYISEEDIDNNNLAGDSSVYLTRYIEINNIDKETVDNINKDLSVRYAASYNKFMNYGLYEDCLFGNPTYFDMVEYLPKETLKVILNTQIGEITNLEVYSKNKKMLNSYLQTLPTEEAVRIKNGLVTEMHTWYVTNYKEINNYYRMYIGLPPIGSDGNHYVDTLTSTYDVKTGTFINFGDKFIDMIPDGIYPELHWRQSELCEFDKYDISILNEYGIIDAYLEDCDTSDVTRYTYLQFLGDNKLDIYTCRKASEFSLIYVPTVDNTSIRAKFIDKFAINRAYTIHNVYSDAYKFQSDYYTKFIIIFILINTIMDVLADIPRTIIDKEIFDSRSIKCLFESNGIPYYSEIPVKYQRAMLKNMNTLIKYKSATRNMIDICALFGFDDIRVFRYYLLKERIKDSNTGAYVFSTDNDVSYDLDKLYVIDPGGRYKDISGVNYTKLLEYRNYRRDRYTHTILVRDSNNNILQRDVINQDVDCYIKDPDNDIFIPLKKTDYFTKIKENIPAVQLKFIKVPIDGTLTEYKNDVDYNVTYDEIVDGDDTWTGGLSDEYIENKIKDYNFNTAITKYISVETVTEMTELSFQVSFFYNMLFDNLYSEETLTVEIPYIKTNYQFKFMDIVCYLFALMYLYNGLEDNIMYSPTQILYIKGYYFSDALNTILQDKNSFTQTKDPMDQENIFDINEQIIANDYKYQKKFEDEEIRIRGFNLDADLDELDEWLSQFQLSLDDFIVDDTLVNFDQIITLRQFYSLNNSYYQKDIFKDALKPTEYNQDIKYAFDYEVVKKEYVNDINGVSHQYITTDDYNYSLLINDDSESIYIFDNDEYVIVDKTESNVLYRKYNKGNDTYTLDSVDYYIRDMDGVFSKLFNGSIFVAGDNNKYLLSANAYYTRGTDRYYEITRQDYFYTDNNLKRVIKLGEYYIYSDGKWVLDPDNCYVIIEQNGILNYVLAKDVGNYGDNEISINDLYVQHGDNHFIRLVETDFYHKNDDGTYTYNEDACYIIVNHTTEYFDPEKPDIFYEKLEDYRTETDVTIVSDMYYVKDESGNYIKEKDLISPNNCYIRDPLTSQYVLAINAYVSYELYTEKVNRSHVLILQEDNDYIKYSLSARNNYVKDQEANIRYIKNSQLEYILLLYTDATYLNTSRLVVVLNRGIDTSDSSLIASTYDPEDDDVWDENDWFYENKGSGNDILGINGENIWYYRKPGEAELSATADEIDEKLSQNVASGFYLAANTYMGSVKIEPGQKYYLAFDVETNFPGVVQIACEADDNLNELTSMNYTFTAGQTQHITQVFTANNIERPRIIFFIYNFTDYPINNGDYFILSNIKFFKGHTDSYIPQDIPSYDKLQEIYRTNEAIYKYLLTMMDECDDHDTYNIYKTLYDSLMTSKYNKEAFKIGDDQYAKTYTDFLQTRDTVLYERLTYFKSLNIEAMQKEIADNIIEVTYAIDDCVDTYSYGYLYSYFPAVSANYIQQYISKIIEFFKSWKVHLLGINTIYKFDDKLENKVKILENEDLKIKFGDEIGYGYINDSVKINPMDDVDPIGNLYSTKYPDLVSVSNMCTDSCIPLDRIQIITSIEDQIIYDGNTISLNINDNTVEAYIDENNNLIVSDGTFDVSLPNELIYNDNEKNIISLKSSDLNYNTTTIQ